MNKEYIINILNFLLMICMSVFITTLFLTAYDRWV